MPLDPRIFSVPSSFAPRYDLGDPPNPEILLDYFREISQALTTLADMVPQASAIEPESPREGMIRLAIPDDGGWNPLSNGVRSWVGFKDGAWSAL